MTREARSPLQPCPESSCFSKRLSSPQGHKLMRGSRDTSLGVQMSLRTCNHRKRSTARFPVPLRGHLSDSRSLAHSTEINSSGGDFELELLAEVTRYRPLILTIRVVVPAFPVSRVHMEPEESEHVYRLNRLCD